MLKKLMFYLFISAVSLSYLTVLAQDNDNNDIPQDSVKRGRLHVVEYPFPEPGILIPYKALHRIFNPEVRMNKLFQQILGLHSTDEFFEWLGVYKLSFETSDETSDENIPRPTNSNTHPLPLGLYAYKNKDGAHGITYNCASCHVGQFLGQHIYGMPNRVNNFYQFTRIGDIAQNFGSRLVGRVFMGMDKQEAKMFARSKKTNRYTRSVVPSARNIDTSVAQIIFSMNKRKRDEYASFGIPFFSKKKVPDYVKDEVVKIQPWWNFKYKNRFMADGSLVEGNFFDFLVIVGEMMFGGDLKSLEKWFEDDEKKVALKDIENSVIATKAPRYEDFFPKSINKIAAQNGQKIYQNECMSCHGEYVKNWDDLSTVRVKYFEQTPVMEVGTVSRKQTLSYLDQMIKDIKIVKDHKIKLVPEEGFVPPPLEGVWLNFPYLHNGSVASLCELLTSEKERMKSYTFSRVKNRAEYDQKCVGYAQIKKNPYLFDTSLKGLSNLGHNYGIDLSERDKFDLIEFLKTL